MLGLDVKTVITSKDQTQFQIPYALSDSDPLHPSPQRARITSKLLTHSFGDGREVRKTNLDKGLG